MINWYMLISFTFPWQWHSVSNYTKSVERIQFHHSIEIAYNFDCEMAAMSANDSNEFIASGKFCEHALLIQ